MGPVRNRDMSHQLRVTFLIDGFNLYHSIKDGDQRDTRSLRWLDIMALCRSCVPVLGKDAWCSSCRTAFKAHEEKETDVAIAVKLLEVLHADSCDTVVLVSGDTDLIPAIHTAQRLFSNKDIVVAFPDKRANAQLRQAVSFSFKIRRKRYEQHQFPDPIQLSSGRLLRKPASW